MTSGEFIEFLNSIGASYKYTDNYGKLEQVYVFDKEAYEKKHKNPKENEDLFVSYLRVSNFGGDLYIRENGICGYRSDNIVKDKCIELTKKIKSLN